MTGLCDRCLNRLILSASPSMHWKDPERSTSTIQRCGMTWWTTFRSTGKSGKSIWRRIKFERSNRLEGGRMDEAVMRIDGGPTCGITHIYFYKNRRICIIKTINYLGWCDQPFNYLYKKNALSNTSSTMSCASNPRPGHKDPKYPSFGPFVCRGCGEYIRGEPRCP